MIARTLLRKRGMLSRLLVAFFSTISFCFPGLVLANANAMCPQGHYECDYPQQKNDNGAIYTCYRNKPCQDDNLTSFTSSQWAAASIAFITKGHCVAANTCQADSYSDTSGKQQPIGSAADSQKAAQEAGQAASGGADSTASGDTKGGSMNGGAGTNPTGTAGVGGGTGTQSGQTPAGATGGACQYCNDAYAGGAAGEQLVQQQARDAQARGETNVGFTNTNTNGGISGGTPVFKGNADAISSLKQIQSLGSTDGISKLSAGSGCSFCDEASLRNWKTGSPVYIVGDSGFLSNAKAAISDLFGWNSGFSQSRGFGSSFFSDSPSWGAPSSNISGFGSAGANAVRISQLGDSGIGSNVTVGGIQDNTSSVVFGRPTNVPGIVTGPGINLTPEQKAQWTQSYNQALAICGGSPNCGAFAQQKADAAVAQMGMNSGANSYLSSCGGFSSCVSQGIDNAKQQFSNALGGAKDALFGSGTDSGVPGIVVNSDVANNTQNTGLIQYAESLPQGVMNDLTPLGPAEDLRLSAYGPGLGCNVGGCDTQMEGKWETSRPNLFGEKVPMTLACFESGDCPAVTLATKDKSLYGQSRFLGDINFKDAEGNQHTARNVIGYYHDYCPGCSSGQADVAVDDLRDTAKSDGRNLLNSQPFSQKIVDAQAIATPRPNATPFSNSESVSLDPVPKFTYMPQEQPALGSLVGDSGSIPANVLNEQQLADSRYQGVPFSGGVSAVDGKPDAFVGENRATPGFIPASEFAPNTVPTLSPTVISPTNDVSQFAQSVAREFPVQFAVAQPDSVTGSTNEAPAMVSQLADLPDPIRQASPFGLDRVVAQEGQTYNFSQMANNVPLGRLNPVLGSSENIYTPSGGYIPDRDLSSLDVANPSQSPFGAQANPIVGGATPDALPQYATRDEQVTAQRTESVTKALAGIKTPAMQAPFVGANLSLTPDVPTSALSSIRSNPVADTPRASTYAVYIDNPLSATPGHFIYANPTPQLGGGYISQASSWAQIPASAPSPFISQGISQSEGNAFPQVVSNVPAGAGYENTLANAMKGAPTTVLGSSANTQLPGGGYIPATHEGQGGAPRLTSDANTAYTSSGPIDETAKVPSVDTAVAKNELEAFQNAQNGTPNTVADATKSAQPTESFQDKLTNYLGDVNKKINDTLAGFGVSVAGDQATTPDTGTVVDSGDANKPTTPYVGVDENGKLYSLPSNGIASADLGTANAKGGMNDVVQNGPFNYYKNTGVDTGTLSPSDLPGAGGSMPTNTADTGTPAPGGTQSDTPGLKPVPDVTKTPGSEYVAGLQKAGVPVGQNVQDQKDAPPTTSGFGVDTAKTPPAGPVAGPGGTGGRTTTGPGGIGGTGGTDASGGKGLGDAIGLLNSAMGLLKSLGGGGQSSGNSSSQSAQPTTPVIANSASVLQTPVPSTQFKPSAPLTAAPKVSVVANPDVVDSGKTSIISWTAEWTDAPLASTTRECALGDATGAVLVAHGDVTGSYETAALTRPTYFLVGCKQTGGKLGSTVVLVKVNGSTQSAVPLPGPSASFVTTNGASTAGGDLSSALYGATPATGSIPANNTQQQQQPVNVACDPNSATYFDCLTGKMQFVDKLY